MSQHTADEEEGRKSPRSRSWWNWDWDDLPPSIHLPLGLLAAYVLGVWLWAYFSHERGSALWWAPFFILMRAVLALLEGVRSTQPIEWLALFGFFAVILLCYIAVHTWRIRELTEGPTEQCRYCRRRYSLNADKTLERTCYRRTCRKRYYRYVTAFDKAENAVLERWKAVAPEADGVLSNENHKRRFEELTEAPQKVERRYGGEPDVRKERRERRVLKTLDAGFQKLAARIDRLSVPKYPEGPPITSVEDLREGDLVIHERYGLARFVGVKKLETEGEECEYVILQYAHGRTFYVPIAQLIDVLSEYEGDPRAAMLDRLPPALD